MSVSRETSEFDVSRETQARLDVFTATLLRWNARINLVSRGDEPEITARHINDALQLIDLIPPGTQRAIDLGSGAGFPGLVLALATGLPFDLVESDQRKCAFLREAARATQAPVKVHAVRIESAKLQQAKLITARALAPLKTLLHLAMPLLAKGGVCIFPKGESAEWEIEEASAAWTMRIERIISRTDRSGVILRISEVTRV
jgi:16S rRNA (guanine527-N7)-methyltransferase